jgi:hypothetical protein
MMPQDQMARVQQLLFIPKRKSLSANADRDFNEETCFNEENWAEFFARNRLPARIKRYTELMRLDRGRADGSLQCLGNSGNTDLLFCQRLQLAHIGWSPCTSYGFFCGLFLLGHNGSSS